MLLRFADCELDPAERVLRRDGRNVDVDPKAFDLLVLLAERAGALLPRPEMLRALWPDTVVSDAAVSQCVRRARVAIGDEARGARRIETVNRHGLRLAVPVTSAVGGGARAAVGSAFVGRRIELARLRAALDGARNRSTRVLLVAGEPGIGKTRLVDELLAGAAADGAAVAWGRCHEDVDMPPYWPWAQATRALADAVGASGLDAEERALLERVLARSDAAPAEPVAAPHDPFALFDRWACALAVLGRRAPLVVALDDLQWADAATRELVRFLARERPSIPLLVVGTFRDSDARTRGDRALEPAALTGGREVLALGALSEQELGALAGTSDGDASLASLHRLTGGNPFFAVEILGALGGAPLTASEALALPPTVRGFVRHRVARLASAPRRLLEAASVLGETAPAQQLARVADDGDVAQALHALVSGGLLHPRGTGELGFVHALVREVVYDGLADAEKARLHERAVRALEAAHDGAAAPACEALARHAAAAVELRARAGDSVDARAVRTALRHAEHAARRAAEIGSWEESARHASRALALPADAPRSGAARERLVIALGEAQMQMGRIDAGVATLREAVTLVRARRSWPDLARVALARVGRFGRSLGAEDAEALALLDEVIAAEPPRPDGADAPLAARVLARRALVYRPPLAPDARASLLGRAERLARAAREPLTLAYVLWARHVSSWDPRERAARTALSGELLALGRAARDVEVEALARICGIRDAVDAGDLTALAREIAAYEAMVDRVLHPVVRFYLTPRRVMHAIAAGRIRDAERLLVEGLQAPDVHGVRTQLFDPLPSQLVLLRREQGRLTELDAALVAAGGSERAPFVVAFQGLVEVARGSLAAARAKLDELAASGFRDVAFDHNRMMVLALAAELCGRVGDAPRAALLEPLLAPFAGEHVVVADGLGYLDTVERPLGLLALARGDRARAAAYLEEALRIHRAIGAPARAAHTELDLAGVVESRDRRAALLGSAAAAARTLDLPGLEAEAERARATLH